MPPLLDQLRQRRDTAREAAEEILTRAADDGRDLTPDELPEHRAHVVAEREAADEADKLRDEQIAELRAGAARNGGPVLIPRSQDLARAVPVRDLREEPGSRSTSAPISTTSGPPTCPRSSGPRRQGPGPYP